MFGYRKWQIGFLTEWQFYAQKLEGDAWAGDKLDKAKVDKMSGEFFSFPLFAFLFFFSPNPPVFWLNADTTCVCLPKDQQLGQLYELMQTIKNNNEGDGENQ